MSLPPAWAETTLGELQRRTSSLDPRTAPHQPFELYSVPSYSSLSPEQVAGAEIGSVKQIIEPDDVLLCKIVPHIRRAWVVPASSGAPQIGSGEWLVYRDPAVEPSYLRRFLLSDGFHEQFMQTVSGVGGSLMRARPAEAGKISVPLPPVAEQRRIVAKLDVLTARLARARAAADAAEKLIEPFGRGLLISAVTGELTKDWRVSNPAQETVGDLLARAAAPVQGRGGRGATDKVIPGVAGLSVNDPGTPVPVGWKWVPLLRVARQETGHTPSRSKPSYWDGNVPWIGIRDAGAHHGRTIYDTAQTISEEGLANSSARLLPQGTVCLSRTASVGYVTMMGRTMATSQDFATWSCTEALLPEYLMYALMAEGDDIRRFGMGSTHTTIYFPEIRAFHIALPPIEEQQEIVKRVQMALARANRLEAEAKKALALIDRLEAEILAKAFRGELVPQDPADESASVLLERIRARRAAEPKTKRGRRPKLAS